MRIGGAAALWIVVATLTATTLASSTIVHPHAMAGAPISTAAAAVWAVDPTVAEASLPPVGRSLFDHVFASSDGQRTIVDVPFPFSRLVQRLEAELASDASGASSVRKVMIPLGRSLQRTVAAPAYFEFPRVVVAVDGQPRSGSSIRSPNAGRLLKDRLYLGYHEQANVLEVISYNEAAGRFEFQVVRDYRAGGLRQVVYANRPMCTACHQNAGPIFSRALWSETHANPAVAAGLSPGTAARYRVDLAQGIDVPYAIDAATDRANLLAAYQWLWQHGCDADGDGGRSAQCRGAMLLAAIQYRLSDGQGFDETDPGYRRMVTTIVDNGRNRWPGGLAISNPDIPNRDPLANLHDSHTVRAGSVSGTPVAGSMEAGFVEGVNVAAAFDPLVPRPPLETWQLAAPESSLRELVAGLAGFFSDEDIARLDDHFVTAGPVTSLSLATLELTCAMRAASPRRDGVRIDFRCKPPQAQGDGQAIVGRLNLAGTRVLRGSLDRLLLPASAGMLVEVRDVDVAGGSVAVDAAGWTATLRLARGSRHVRAPDGSRVIELRLQGHAPLTTLAGSFEGAARVTVHRDFGPIREAIVSIVASANSTDHERTQGALADAPFRRATVLHALSRQLGMPQVLRCCEDGAGLPPAVVDTFTPIANGERPTTDEMLLHRYCALCHRTAERFPPNFLAGDSAEVRDRIAHCAPRIYVRLAMWRRHGDARPKSPMPPATALAGARLTEAAWQDSTELAALTAYMANILQTQTGKPANVDDLLRGSYERLRACLPKTG